MLNTPSATPGAARSPHSLHPAVPTARGCPGITQPGHCSTMAQPCLLLPEQSLKLFLLRKKNNSEEGKGERRKPSGLSAAHRGHGHLLLGTGSTTRHPLSPVLPVCPLPSGPARPGSEAAVLRLQHTKEQAWNNGASRPAAMPASASASTRGASGHRGTASPARRVLPHGCCHTGALCWCKIPAGDTRHPQPRHVPNPPFLAQFRQPLA